MDVKKAQAVPLEADVLIVGGGPVGLGLAIELGQRDIRCVLVERYQQPQPIPRGQNLTQRTLEHFHFWGAEKQLRAARTIPPEFGIGGLTSYGHLLSPHYYDWLQRELVKPYYFCANERLPQYATENVLRQRLAQLPTVQTFFGWDAQTVDQDAQGVTIKIGERHGAGQQTLKGAYAVGCDGSRSKVREQAGITQTLSDHDRLMVLLVFRSQALHTLLARYPGKSFFSVLHPSLQGYWKFFGRVDLGNTWFFHAPVPAGTTADNFDFKAYVQEAVGAPFEMELEHIGFWDLRFAIADTYQAGRLFVAGDAAHSHPPYGGYGVNAGLEDARNLGWKLAAMVQGWGGKDLLSSYGAERQPVFASTMHDFIAQSIETDKDFLANYHPARDKAAFEKAWQARSQGAIGEVHAFEPHYEGSPVVCFDDPGDHVSSAKGSHRFEARTGHHIAPVILSTGHNIYQALGAGFSLLAIGARAEDTAVFENAAKALGLPLTVISEAAGQEADRYQAAWVLVRPDQFIAWVGKEISISPQKAQNVLTRARGNALAPLA